MFAAEISILLNTKFHVYTLTCTLQVSSIFTVQIQLQQYICMFLLGEFTCLAACQHLRGIFTYTCSCSSCVCVCVCGMVMVCGKKTWMHLKEHLNTFVQVTFWPQTLNSYDTLTRIMQQNATIYEK